MLKPKCAAAVVVGVPLLLGCGSTATSLPSPSSTVASPIATVHTSTTSLGGPLRRGPTGIVKGRFIASGGPPGAKPSPQKGIVTFVDADGQTSIQVASGADGTFSIVLPVGTYTVTGHTPQYVINDREGLCAGGDVTVKRGRTSSATVGCGRR